MESTVYRTYRARSSVISQSLINQDKKGIYVYHGLFQDTLFNSKMYNDQNDINGCISDQV